jgi:hypothetical protein
MNTIMGTFAGTNLDEDPETTGEVGSGMAGQALQYVKVVKVLVSVLVDEVYRTLGVRALLDIYLRRPGTPNTQLGLS